MATVRETVGASDANSYVTVGEATTYFGERLNAGAWTTAGTTSPEQQGPALIMAARRLEQARWQGRKADEAQALAWPRTGTHDPDGILYDSDTIPTPVKRAQMELALVLLNEGTTDWLADSGLEGFKGLKVGPLAMETKPRSAGTLPANVSREVAHVLASSGATVRMERG